MTTKEIAEFTGRTERCIRKWIVKAAEKSSSVAEKNSSAGHGKVADYTIDEVEQILLSGSFSRDAVSILMQNARNNIPAVNNNNKLETMFIMFMEQQKEFNKTIISLVNNQKLAPQLEYIQDYYSIIGFANNNNIIITFSEAQSYGKQAASLSRMKGVEIRTVPDERFGSVKSYRIDILKEVFNI